MFCEFSETQFVFGILNELVTRCWTPRRAWSAPVFPSQRQELNLGYDVMIRGCVRTLYFQFKVPEKKTMANAKYWTDFGGPYYEFEIWPDDKTHQHNLLVDLANRDLRNKVYYCAPAFHTQAEYECYYAGEKISRRSIYVPCGGLPKISGSDRHDISYIMEPSRLHIMHSEEHLIEAFDIEELKRDAEDAAPYASIEECVYRIAEQFRLDIGRVESDNFSAAGLYRIADLLLVKENLHLLLLGE